MTDRMRTLGGYPASGGLVRELSQPPASVTSAPWFHCAECAELAKNCKHDNHAVSADGGKTWWCQGCARPMEMGEFND